MKDNHILVTNVPTNMTHLFQPLELIVNKAAKDYTKQKFSDWLSTGNRLSIECSEAPSRKMAHIFLQLYDYHEGARSHF